MSLTVSPIDVTAPTEEKSIERYTLSKMTDLAVPNGHTDRVIEHASPSFELSLFSPCQENRDEHASAFSTTKKGINLLITVNDFHPREKSCASIRFYSSL